MLHSTYTCKLCLSKNTNKVKEKMKKMKDAILFTSSLPVSQSVVSILCWKLSVLR